MRLAYFMLLLMFLLPHELFADVGFFSVLPNPAGDDALGEYIEIRNGGCSEIDIGGYTIRDLQRSYTIPSGTIISSQSNLRITYDISRIQLNNTWNEALTLSDTGGTVIHTLNYTDPSEEEIILSSYIDDICLPPPPSDPPTDGSGSTDLSSTGTHVTASGADSWTGSMSNSGSEYIPDTSSGEVSSSGIIIMGSGSDTGSGIFTESSTGSLTGTWITGSGGGASTSTGEIYDSWSWWLSSSGPNIGSWAIESSSGILFTGSTLTGESLGTGVFLPLTLQYDDRDSDNKIDTLIIEYSHILTGVFLTGSLALYSQTGWLSTERINTLTGYILEGTLSGRFLILTLLEGDLEKTTLTINNTTSSDLRLKTLSVMGIHSVITEENSPDILLMSSFSNYREVSRYGENNWTSEIVSNSWNLSATGILFPEILPVLQSPTNAILSGSAFLCDQSNLPCRINFTLDPIFSGAYQKSKYLCQISTWWLIISNCNPATFYFLSTGILSIDLTDRSNTGSHSSKSYDIIFGYRPSSGYTTTLSTPDTNPPIIILEHDAKWKEYYEQISDTELVCHTMTCSLNFTAERSYDPEWGKVRFMWMYDMSDLKTSKDPGVVKFWLGEHEIWLRVIDESGNFSSLRYRIRVVGDRPKIEKEKIIKGKKEKNVKILSSTSTEKKKKMKKLKMQFFTTPQIVLQGKTFNGWVSEYRCTTTKKSCQINLTLSWTQKNYEYEWILSDGTIMRGKNPKWWTLPVGKHSVILNIYLAWETVPYWSETYSLIAEKKLPKKKTPKKKPSSKKSTSSLIKTPEIIPAVQAESLSEAGESSTRSWIVFLITFVIIILITRRYSRKRE